MTKIKYKKMQYLIAFLTLIILSFSFYLQYQVGLQPCPLCLMQRLCVFLILILLGINLRTLKKAHLVSLIQAFVAAGGLFFSLRQLWLQALPSGAAPTCMPGLDILIQYFPWQTVAKALFWGSGDCGEATWTWLGISLPGWSALYFFFIMIVSLFLAFRTQTV